MDNYTKGVLTVIAICLVSITFQLSGTQTIKSAYALEDQSPSGEYASTPIYVHIVNK
jgi:hypothetical protein